MNRYSCQRWLGWFAGTVLISAACTAFAENVLVTKNKTTYVAKSIRWRESSQEYMVDTMDGTTIPVAKSQVDSLKIDRPDDFDKAATMVKAGQYATAIPLLEGIVTAYTMLNWDNEARQLLADAYLGAGDPKKAVSALDALFASAPKSKQDVPTRQSYWKALQGAQRNANLRAELDDAIAKEAPPLAAAAQLARGDLNRAEGKKEDALLDYWRVVVLYEQVKELQPEAMLKSAEILDELRDGRAQIMRNKLREKYPNSKEAKQSTGKTSN